MAFLQCMSISFHNVCNESNLTSIKILVGLLNMTVNCRRDCTWYTADILQMPKINQTLSYVILKQVLRNVCCNTKRSKEALALNSERGYNPIFFIHVSQTREGFNPPFRPSFRRGSNSNQTRNIGFAPVWRNELPSLVWLPLDPCLSDGLSGEFNPPFVWLTWIQNWIVLYLRWGLP